MGKIFGTDGARGIAGTELTCDLAMKIGRAAARVLTEEKHHKPVILIGTDTRQSCKMLEAAITAGLCSVGADVRLLGVIPTPAVAYLVGKYEADAGVMISASHNPYEYNGIKLFNSEGFKLSDELEEKIEEIILAETDNFQYKTGKEVGTVTTEKKAAEDYIRHIISTVPAPLEGIKVAVDCANGAASMTAKTLLESLGADVYVIHDEPNGLNINAGCGSTHMEVIAEYVKTHRCHAGLSFDGDADRCLAVDEEGNLIDGDKLMAIFAQDMMEKGTLEKNTVVVTVMTNLGFCKFCEEKDIKLSVTKVGDRYVLEEMIKNGNTLGGEQSGHIIFLKHATTGDGQLTAVSLLSVMKQRGERLSKIASIMERFPQVMVNVKVDNEGKAKFDADAIIAGSIGKAEKKLGKDGRVLVRVSGTEPLIRVMIEGKNFDEINHMALGIADVIKERLC